MPEKTRNVTRNVDDIPLIKIKHNFFKNTFYLQSLNGTRDPLFLKLKSSNWLDAPEEVVSQKK